MRSVSFSDEAPSHQAPMLPPRAPNRVTGKHIQKLKIFHANFHILLSDFKSRFFTGKSLLEASILSSTNPKYDRWLFIDLPVQYMKTASLEHVVYMKKQKQFMYTTCS